MYVMVVVISFIIGYIMSCLIKKRDLEKKEQIYSGIKKNEEVLNQWLVFKQVGIGLDKILKEQNIETVAIYGMGIMGRHILRELINSDIVIRYGLDNKRMTPIDGIPVKSLRDELEKPDAVINSVLKMPDKENIEKEIQEVVGCRVISLDTLLFNYSYLNKEN